MILCNIIIICVAILGAIFIVLGGVLGWVVLLDYVDNQIEEQTRLEPGSEQYDRFIELPFPIDFNIHYFNVTNPDKVMKGDKPIVKEVGPFIYKLYHNKTNVRYDEFENRITYQQSKAHILDPERSTDILTKITILNAPLINLVHTLDQIGLNFLMTALNTGYQDAFNMEPDTLFHTVTAEELSFEGYQFCKPSELVNNKAAKMLCALLRISRSPSMEIQTDRSIKFSFFKQKDLIPDGVYQVGNGMKNIAELGEIFKWKGSDKTNFWVQDDGVTECNSVKGTDASIYRPFNDKESRFTTFSTDICRTTVLEFEEEIEYKEIPGYRNVVKDKVLNMDLPENTCYCIKKVKDMYGRNECLPSGFMDLSTCVGAPIILSLPHFLWANKEYQETIVGLEPNEVKHRIFIDMEPGTGSPLRGAKSIQLNVVLRNISLVDVTNDVANSMMPLVWVQEYLELPDDLVEKLKDEYLSKLPLVDIARWVLIGVGLAVIVCSTGLMIYRRKK